MPDDIKTGQRFRDTAPTVFGRAPPDWIVDRVFVGTDGNEYAEIHAATNPSERKTLSTAILRDRRRFVEAPTR